MFNRDSILRILAKGAFPFPTKELPDDLTYCLSGNFEYFFHKHYRLFADTISTASEHEAIENENA